MITWCPASSRDVDFVLMIRRITRRLTTDLTPMTATSSCNNVGKPRQHRRQTNSHRRQPGHSLARHDHRPAYTTATSILRAAFGGWCDVHDRTVITQREQKAVKEAAIRKAAKKEQRKLAIASKYAETDAARAAMEGQSTAQSGNKDTHLLRHPPMSAEERERDAKRRERAKKARESVRRRPR